MNIHTHHFKVLLIGDTEVGKTSFLKKFFTKTFDERYIPTTEIDLQTIEFNTNKGLVILDIWECNGNEKWRDSFFGVDAIIMMYDSTFKCNYFFNKIQNSLLDVYNKNDLIPTVIVGNKIDLILADEVIDKDRYYGISIKTGENIYSPITRIIQDVMKDPEIVLDEL